MLTPLHRRCIIAAISVIFAGTCISASAQYVWLDEKGVKQFSDQAPPSSVPAARIIKQPGMRPTSVPANTQPTAATPNAEKTTAEKNAEFRKRRLDREEREKKSADEAKLAADKARACERMQEYQRSLESGVRISRTDKNGEQTYLSDEQRAREIGETQRMLNECRS